MARTAEQVAADDALTAAVHATLIAYHGPDPGVLTDYLVVGLRRDWDEDGDPITANYSIPRDGDVPLSHLLGLVEWASTRFRARIAED
ncbi:MAG: hypothetical protein WBD41_14215 [Rhodococcus sp. (in: high G+C Gram-positive bacteria)]